VKIHALDVADDYQVKALAKTLADVPIDLLINSAGLGSPEQDEFGKTPANDWLEVLRVNAIAPMHVVEQFVGNLEAGQRKLIVNITSKMGSIADNTTGGSYIYRTSKAALNMVAKGLAQDLKAKRMIVVVFHPGWVKTDMGGAGATLTPEKSVTAVRRVIDRLGPGDSGKFYNHDGREYPW
jgi:NAD(P)-dependent dehydrogenase (short-subunit alcohol dehydrogenase family)